MNVLFLNQCFHPDVAATAQLAGDLAAALTKRGHSVTAIASSRGYDNPEIRFPYDEEWNGVRILRVPCVAGDKKKRWARALNFASFLLMAFWRIVRLPKFDVVIALTTPPLISVMGAIAVKLRGGRFVYWVMDMNPDQAVAAGWLREGSWIARVLERLSEFSTSSAETIIVLDRFMRDRLLAKGIPEEKIVVAPPWSREDKIRYDSQGRNVFREKYGLAGKYVVMYAGNHSPCHPLDTILEAALALKDEPGIAFCFIGGGSEQKKVRAFAERHQLRSILCLPYHPPEVLAGPLSAGDLQLVVMGEPFVGIVHPCKIYNLLAVGLPILFIGPASSHVTDIARGADLPITQVEHGDVDGVIRRIRAGGDGIPDERLLATASGYSSERALRDLTAVIDSSAASQARAETCKILGRG